MPITVILVLVVLVISIVGIGVADMRSTRRVGEDEAEKRFGWLYLVAVAVAIILAVLAVHH